ncbi:hypothetical protein F6Y05_02880 (plasmid) [Bacillus megaterium]|nr:hypothetical protein [Priestia megaterium]
MGKSYFHYQHNHNGWDRLPKTTFFKWQDKKKYQMLSNNNDQFISSSDVKQLDFLSDKVFVHSSERLVEKTRMYLRALKGMR